MPPGNFRPQGCQKIAKHSQPYGVPFMIDFPRCTLKDLKKRKEVLIQGLCFLNGGRKSCLTLEILCHFLCALFVCIYTDCASSLITVSLYVYLTFGKSCFRKICSLAKLSNPKSTSVWLPKKIKLVASNKGILPHDVKVKRRQNFWWGLR